MSICNWSNLPEGVVTLVASHFDGQRKDVIRALRGVCKPWRADIAVAVTKATMPKGAEAPVWQVLQKTPKLRSLTVVEASEEQCKTLLAEIRIVKKLVPELESFVFDKCVLSLCKMPLSECLGKSTRELELRSCCLSHISIAKLCDFQHLTSLTYVNDPQFYDDDDEFWICVEVFTNLPSLQSLSVTYLTIDLDTEPNLPNVTSLSLEECIIGHPNFLRGLLRLEDLNLKGTTFMDDSDVVTELPVSITALNIRSLHDTSGTITYEGFCRLGSRLPLLSSLHVGGDGVVSDEVLAVISRMHSLTRLSLVDCILVTDAGLVHLARSASLTWLEIKECEDVTREGVDALRAAAPSIEIVFEAV
jgi:hypothetical protein